MGYIRDPTPPTTLERVRNEVQQNECNQRVLESPDYHRTPHNAQLGTSVPTATAPAPPGRGRGRGIPRERGRGRGNNTTVTTPLSIVELNARYAALQPVSLILLLYLFFFY